MSANPPKAYTLWTQGHAGRLDRLKDATNLQLCVEKLTLRLVIIVVVVVVGFVVAVVEMELLVLVFVSFIGYLV